MNTHSATHEFNNQIAIILGFVELLIAETDKSSRRCADLLEVQKAAQRMLALLPDVVVAVAPEP
jgi:signal transduction histidine kinase